MSLNELSPIAKAAQKHYNPQLPYHNWNHVEETVSASQTISRNCLMSGKKVNFSLVTHCLFFHDAGYGEDQTLLGFETKEEYSAQIARDELKTFKLSQNYIDLVAKGVLSTNRDAPFITVEEMIIRASDLAGLAGSYEKFYDANQRLKKETEMLTGKKISNIEWKEMSEKIINFYLSQDIHLTNNYNNNRGESIFHTQVRANLNRLLNS